jgi:predicted DNA-binding protein
MSRQMVVRIDDDTKDKFFKIARMEGKTASEKLREMIEHYVSENDLSEVIDKLWRNISRKLAKKGVKEADIDEAIAAVRKSK